MGTPSIKVATLACTRYTARMADDDEKQINDMTRDMQQALIPVVSGVRVEITLPAVLQVAMTMAMFALECSPLEAIDTIISALEETKRRRAN